MGVGWMRGPSGTLVLRERVAKRVWSGEEGDVGGGSWENARRQELGRESDP